MTNTASVHRGYVNSFKTGDYVIDDLLVHRMAAIAVTRNSTSDGYYS